jgi:hypothetical protein
LNDPRTYVYIKKNIFFSRTSRPISIKVGINHPWVKGFLNGSNKGPDPLQKGDNLKKCKNGEDSIKEPLIQNRSHLHESV